MDCVDVWPRGLNPSKTISRIKEIMVRRPVQESSEKRWEDDQLAMGDLSLLHRGRRLASLK
jgi:hypothetical protein